MTSWLPICFDDALLLMTGPAAVQMFVAQGVVVVVVVVVDDDVVVVVAVAVVVFSAASCALRSAVFLSVDVTLSSAQLNQGWQQEIS